MNTAPRLKENATLRHVARQPILNAKEQIFGYELLFRDGIQDYFCSPDPEAASRSTLDTSMVLGLDVLCDGHRAFINCTRDMLLKDYVTLLPPQQTAVEVLASIPPDDLVTAACHRLKEMGYLIALDNFVANDPRASLTPLANLIKIDFRNTPHDQMRAIVKQYSSSCEMLAVKIETREEFATAREMGFTYFQGYFFCRPQLMQAREIPANRINYLRLLQAVSKEEMDSAEVENIIKSEAAICYRLLRYLNSAAFGFASEIHSIRHGLSILGEREVRRWIRLVATLGSGQGKSRELVLAALVRARFCELLASRVRHGDSDLFLLGLLSLMDGILELPMYAVLENIPVDHDTKALLLGENNHLRPIYQLMVSMETGDWDQIRELVAQLRLQESFVAESHWHAMQWAREVGREG